MDFTSGSARFRATFLNGTDPVFLNTLTGALLKEWCRKPGIPGFLPAPLSYGIVCRCDPVFRQNCRSRSSGIILSPIPTAGWIVTGRIAYPVKVSARHPIYF